MTRKKTSQEFTCPATGKSLSQSDMSRRSFLKATGMTLAGLGMPLTFNSCDDQPLMLPKPEAPSGTISVGITRKADIEQGVRTAIEMAGGLNEIRHGDKVVIKPNITGPEMLLPARIYTHPRVLQAVIRAVKERTPAGNITVAEASAFWLPTRTWAWEVGVIKVCEDEGVHFMAWETENYVTVFSDYFDHIDFNFRVPESLFDGSFDHFINVPVLKNHEMMPDTNVDYTCCIKNHVGVVHPVDRLVGGVRNLQGAVSRPILHMGIHKETLGDISAELNLAVPRHTMNVVDALSVVLTGGPAGIIMDKADPGLILASKDRVACDSLAVAVLKHYARLQGIDRPYVDKSVWDQAQIVRAQQLNLGRTRDRITIVAEDVEDLHDILTQWV